MAKRYVEDGTHLEATSVDFTVCDTSTGLSEPAITFDADLKAWNEKEARWIDVRWDFSQSPARLYYYD